MGFRIVVRLSKYYEDERVYSYIYVNETHKFIYHLESYLVELFSIDGPFCLMKDDYLLPSCENIKVIQADEIISVVPLEKNFVYTNISKPNQAAIEATPEKDSKKKKRKKHKEIIDEIILNENESPKISEKNSKNKVNIPYNLASAESNKTNVFDNPEVFTAIQNIEELHSKLKKAEEPDELDAIKSKALILLRDHFPINTNGVSDGRIKKRKRLRIRKSKKNTAVDISSMSDVESNITQLSTSFTSVNGNSNSHIRFSTPSEKTSVKIIRNQTVSQSLNDKPRIIQAIQHKISVQVDNSVERDEVEEHFETQNSEKLQLHTLLKNVDKYQLLKETLPNDNSIILFKMLKMDENYAPVISDYILGSVQNSCNETHFLKISIIDGHESTPRGGKFDLDDELNDNQNDTIELQWNLIIEPRLVQK